MKKNFDLIIFDWDGTLVDSIGWIVQCIQYAAESCACSIPQTQAAKDIIGLSLNEALQHLFPAADAAMQEALTKAYRGLFFSKTIGRDDLFAGVYEMLCHLQHAGYSLAVATGKTRSGLNWALQGTGTTELFNITRCADETASKPDPAMIREILENLKIAKHRALMVGDSIHDLEMAENAEIQSVAVSCGAHAPDLLQEYRPLHCLQQTKELLEIL